MLSLPDEDGLRRLRVGGTLHRIRGVSRRDAASSQVRDDARVAL